jgi:hypothetical protein
MDAVLERKLVVEFVGMFLFLFTVGMATNKAGAGAIAPLAIGSVLTLMLMVLQAAEQGRPQGHQFLRILRRSDRCFATGSRAGAHVPIGQRGLTHLVFHEMQSLELAPQTRVAVMER